MSTPSLQSSSVSAFLLSAWLHVAASSVLGAQPVHVDLPDGVGDWVVHEDSGRVFASFSSGDEIVEYDSAGKEVRRLKVSFEPVEMLIKGDRLIVGCKKSPSLHVIDLKSNRSLGSISLMGVGPYGLFCSQVDNGFVYAICNTGTAWWDGQIFQCDINTLKVRKQVPVQGWSQSHPVHVAMSRDGKWIVPDARGSSSPSGADLMKVDEDECTFVPVRNHHDSFGQIVAAPDNRHWTLGEKLYPLDLTVSIREFAGSPVVIHPRLDLAVSKAKNGLVLQRFSDAAPIANVTLVNTVPKKERRDRDQARVLFDPTIQFDLKNNRIFCGERTSGTWIDLKDYQASLAPLLLVQAPSEVTSLVNKPLRVPLAITNGGKNAKLVIADGPNGASLENGDFVWQPGAEDVGISTVRLELQSATEGRTLDAVNMTVQITLPKVELGFRAHSMELSPNERYLLVWGVVPRPQDEQSTHSTSNEIAVIDLQEVKMVTRKTLPQGVRCATIDDEFVFVAPNSGNLIYRLSRELANSQRVFLQSAPNRLVKLGKQRLAALGERTEFLDTQTMKRLDAPPNTDSLHYSEPYFDEHSSELILGEHVFDRETGELVRDVRPSGLPGISVNRDNYDAFGDREFPFRTQWGRRLIGAALTNYKGSAIARFPDSRYGLISDRWPMAILISSSTDHGFTTTTLELANLVDGKIEHSAVIDVSVDAGQSFYHGPRYRLRVAGDQLVLLGREEVLLYAIPQAIAKAMPTPTYFKPPPTEELEVGPPAKIPLAIEGKTEGVSLNLLTEYPGVTIEGPKRELTIDTKVLWETYLKQLTPERLSYDDLYDDASEFDPANNAKEYRRAVGKELPKDKFATQLSIVAVLHDAEGQEDRLQFRAVVLGPRKDIDSILGQRKAVFDAKRTAAEEAYKREQAAFAKAAAAARSPMQGQGDQSTEKRLEDMEARLRRIEAALDAVLKKLDER